MRFQIHRLCARKREKIKHKIYDQNAIEMQLNANSQISIKILSSNSLVITYSFVYDCEVDISETKLEKTI